MHFSLLAHCIKLKSKKVARTSDILLLSDGSSSHSCSPFTFKYIQCSAQSSDNIKREASLQRSLFRGFLKKDTPCYVSNDHILPQKIQVTTSCSVQIKAFWLRNYYVTREVESFSPHTSPFRLKVRTKTLISQPSLCFR